MNRTVLLVVFTIFFQASDVFAEANWPQFRGSSSGIAEDKALPDTWSATPSSTENIVWAVEIPGRGWSSPVVWGDKIFVTSAIKEGDFETPRKGLYLGGDRDKASDRTHRWMVYCIDWNDGKFLWERLVHKQVPQQPVHLKNTYASETPVTDGRRLYVYFGSLGTFCYDLDGNKLWSQEWPSFKIRNNWGTAASPVLHGDQLYIVNDNEEQSFIVALDKKTGKQIWRTERDENGNWATPYIWQNKQRTELITSGRRKVRSYDLDGRLLWELGGMSSIVIPTPLAKHDLLYICSGFVGDRKNRPIYAIRPGASGDITPKDEQDTGKYIAWYHKFGGPYNPSPLVYGDYLYVLYDRGFLSCYDARTGIEVYSMQRIAAGAMAFTSSPWANNGKIFCLSEDGDTFVIQAGPTFKVLGSNKLDEMCMATPAALRGSLIIRTISKLYRIQD